MREEKPLLARPMKKLASDLPVIDELTRKMTAAWRKGSQQNGQGSCTLMTCSCKVAVPWAMFLIGEHAEFYTSALCIHSIAYHRDEISQKDLEKVRNFPFEGEDPREGELKKPDGGPWALGWFRRKENSK